MTSYHSQRRSYQDQLDDDDGEFFVSDPYMCVGVCHGGISTLLYTQENGSDSAPTKSTTALYFVLCRSLFTAVKLSQISFCFHFTTHCTNHPYFLSFVFYCKTSTKTHKGTTKLPVRKKKRVRRRILRRLILITYTQEDGTVETKLPSKKGGTTRPRPFYNSRLLLIGEPLHPVASRSAKRRRRSSFVEQTIFPQKLQLLLPLLQPPKIPTWPQETVFVARTSSRSNKKR